MLRAPAGAGLVALWGVLCVARAHSHQPYELLLCRACGADVADGSYLLDKLSPNARRTEKQALFGRQNLTVQTLVNPFGIKFDVITIEKARCGTMGTRQSAESWFPGYTWRICACPHCGHHLGWTFESVAERERDDAAPAPPGGQAGPGEDTNRHVHKFHGLIMSNILGENFTDSLLMIPKTYKM